MLWRKLFRDIKENKGAYLACVTIILIGLMLFSSLSIVMDNLKSSQQAFYYHQNFADGFVDLKAMPLSEVNRLQTIKGIKDIQGRMIKDVRVAAQDKAEDRSEEVYLRLISIDPTHPRPINDMHLLKGQHLQNDVFNIWVDNQFFEANHLNLNDSVEIIANGKKIRLYIAGTGFSPEFVYTMRTANDLFPHPETFGIAYVPFEIMKTFFAEGSTVNNLVFTLEQGVEYEDVKEQLEPRLKSYGLISIYPRKDQISHSLLTQELNQMENMSKSLPVLFLAIACMILYIMLKRTVENQRGQIGILMAMGYTRGEITLHYLSFALLIGFSGGLLGGLSGLLLSFPLIALYQAFFNIPGLQITFSFSYLIMSVLLALAFALFAGYQGCKSVLALQPAEAMRPPAPPKGKSILLEKFTLFWNALTVQGKMSLRSMSRHPGRTAFMFLGVMFAFSLLGSPWSMMEMMETLLYDQYEKVEIYDLKVNLSRPLTQRQAERELNSFPGTRKAEGRAEIPVTLKNNWHKKEIVLLGLPQNSELYKIRDSKGKPVQPPADGILLSESLAQNLEAKVGTKLQLESPFNKEPDQALTVEVTGIIPQYLGLNAYMELNALQNLLGQKELITTIMLSVNESSIPLLKEHYQNSSVIESFEDQNETLRKSKELMATFSGTVYIFLFMGLIIGFAIIYNISTITVSERSRELASMMVLGMTPQEVLSVITFEQWFISILAMLTGIPVTKLLLIGLSQSLDTDLFTMPTTLSATSILAAFLITIVCIRFAQLMAARKIKKLSLVEVLKARE
ncbi:MAG TPA: FtsX-like permease family protein [Peptococcaceae bacterium]|jgi:putative ABC transport system permease protein|nr:FtsX-like permease family protein [Clostridia bacterium]HOB82723.1 FtsX-like permease family protein [Peptococcaceae bacterium]HPZ72073.1 FtsX-like permease family protein [Peptococcaceae bacterium]HQD54457.1 FtsX-like permease family protein [Peptococcaceae bacterium]